MIPDNKYNIRIIVENLFLPHWSVISFAIEVQVITKFEN
jgi:hypothetical protein